MPYRTQANPGPQSCHSVGHKFGEWTIVNRDCFELIPGSPHTIVLHGRCVRTLSTTVVRIRKCWTCGKTERDERTSMWTA